MNGPYAIALLGKRVYGISLKIPESMRLIPQYQEMATDVTPGEMTAGKLSNFMFPIVQHITGNLIGLRISHVRSDWSAISMIGCDWSTAVPAMVAEAKCLFVNMPYPYTLHYSPDYTFAINE